MSEMLYAHHARHLVAVDCIIFGFEEDRLKLLLIQRDFPPEKGMWSLMGGFVGMKEGVDEAAQRVLTTLTGLHDVYLEQVATFGGVRRDTAARVISVAYYALINIHEHDESLSQEHGAAWFDVHELPALIFDHQEMVEQAKSRLKRQATTQPVGFALLPDKFTLPQLQKLYEAILDEPIDKRNFQKRIHAMNLLVKLNEKQKGYSKRGAYFYRFDPERYDRLRAEGLTFLLK
uniref:NUDIX domain-containing protein n=1 Tax=Roseihalotalea indica TaxID=2867963 RepID=A0AA49GK75_9BACT|nr:NUDIX domain-containing protein [Tunicatimonas sp. TK19036]